MRLRKGLALVLLLSLFLLVACSSKQSAAPASSPAAAAKPVDLQFVFPVAVGGGPANAIEAMVKDFNTANPNIKVTPVFAGNYQDTMAKVQTLVQGGTPPEVVVLQATDVFTLTDMKAVVPVDDYLKADADGQTYISDFLPAFMGNSKIGGQTYGIPFQRSTVVLYYNKDLFKANGIAAAPKSWQELVADGHKLTKDGVWGVEIPSDGNPYWTFSSFFIENGKNVANADGTEVYLNDQAVAGAMDFITGLSKTEKIMPSGIIKWGDVPNDFTAGKVAMMYHTTGSIGALLGKMDASKIGVAPAPAGKQFGSPTGGGNVYILKTTKEKQDAAWKFVRFITDTNRVASWSVATGYVPTRKSAQDTQTWKDAVKKFDGYQTVLDAMQYADREMATHQNQQVLKAFGDQLQAIVTGSKDTKTALDQAQKDATAILTPFKK
ncbi:MAG: ABC transporter substrate-binding protein [Mycobacterium leprae]